MILLKKWTAAAMATLLLLPYAVIGKPQEAAASANRAVIREGSTYLLDFESGTMQNSTYHDGNSNAFKFSGDTGHVSLNGGQMVLGPFNGSTIGVFDYGFASNPTNKFEDFELSFDMTMTHRELNKQAGIQFQKNAWNDGWDAQFKTHVTYDGKMNFFEGATSIANMDGGKYRGIKEYGVPGLNRDIMPWETFRVKQVVDGKRVRTYVNGSTTPIVDVLRASEVGAGFVGVFANGNAGFKMDNFLLNKLKPENERDDFGLAGDIDGFYVYIPVLNESVSNFNIHYRNTTDNTNEQIFKYSGTRDKYVRIDGLTPNKDYKVELYPVYKSDRTQIETDMTMYRSKTVHVGQSLQTQLTVTEGETFYGGSKQIDISVIGAEQIRYTLDGSEPTISHGYPLSGDFIFGDSLVVDKTTNFKAIALLHGEIKAQREETYVAGVNPVSLTNAAIFHVSQPVVMQSVYADSLLYTTDGTNPLYDAVTDTAANGTIVHAPTVSLTVTETTYLKAMAVRGGLAGAIASAKYTKVPLGNTLVTDWNFTSPTVILAQEQDDLYGKTSAPWSNLLGWDANSDKGVWANHIETDNVYRDSEGVHLFTTSAPIEASTSNPNFYLDLHDAGFPNIPADYRYLSIWMKVNHTANAAIYFGTDAGADTNKLSESRKVAFRNTAVEVPEFQHYIIDMGEHAGWTGNITKLRIDPMATYPSMKDGIALIVKGISLLRKQDLPAEIRLTQFETSPQEIVSPGDSFVIKAKLENIGAGATGLSVQLDAPDFLEITPVGGASVTQLASGESVTLTYNATVQGTGAGAIVFSVKGLGIPATRGVSRIFSVNTALPASGQPDDVVIGNEEERLVYPSPETTGLEGYGFAWVEAMRSGAWSRIAVMPSLGSVQEIVGQDQLTVKELYAAAPSSLAPRDFEISFQAPDGAEWSGAVRVTDSVYGNLELKHSLQADRIRNVAAIVGPTMLLGEAGIPALDSQHKVIRSTTDLQGDYINEALFPGLEWLDAMEKNNRSSDTNAVVDTVDAYRYVPHPRKITVPLMAIRKGDLLFGLMWDARQKWDGVHDQPSAFFGLPNRLERGNETVSTKLSLFIPSILNGMNENTTFATGIPAFYDTTLANANNENPIREPFNLAADQVWTLKSQLFVKRSTEIASAVHTWTDEYGLPEPLAYAHGTMQQESEAILTSFENLWSAADNKWMNRIGPAATPTITSAFVMPYAVLGKYGEYDEVAKQRISSAMTGVGSTYSTYGYILPYYLEGIAARTMESLQSVNVDTLVAAAKLVNPSSVTEGVYWDYQTFIARKGFQTSPYMGQLTDVTAGSNAEFLFKMLRQARLTGNAVATTYGLAGLNYMNESFRMPRGSQSWELRNMIPELETAAVAVRANVEAYSLTGSTTYLDAAKLWANRGFPFIYLWDDGSYGVDKADGQGSSFGSHTFMRYGAIAAFGQSIYRADGKPLPGTWFGRSVQWSGHDYGIALMELYEAMDGAGLWTNYLNGGGIDYRKISEGLSVSGSRQTTAADNRYPTHLYDAASLLKWETSDYLYPNYQGAELLGLLLGERTNPITQKITVGAKELRISAPVVFDVLNIQTNQFSLRLNFLRPGEYTIFLQGIAAIGQAQLVGTDQGLGAELTSYAVRSSSGFAEVHLKVTAEGASQAEIALTSVVLK
ncbi:chitobiase/beta-hexosaminidase C-terminal domain-containing protein [Paenibacillus sp. HWE-109]|uniref:chitobiase/beta-hexosaminidase C-terminal domain-containing protein n=1 Tax=Paenibacillus sp. HWE-109 TaxID=1306526 RepID=UPI001EDD7556|nr:chitobiase/beta-hexosaminidase C-terminal domain-containing protein [Paenibacillus sp. HWE-109]UKS29996.1 chitobiase/beta-hexosaminidase C-terminal domain-containing protein [Paenibacillus sp. HWE-109]